MSERTEARKHKRHTPLGTGILPPPSAMSKGQPFAGLVPVGNLILLWNETELEEPPDTPPALTVRVVPENEPET